MLTLYQSYLWVWHNFVQLPSFNNALWLWWCIMQANIHVHRDANLAKRFAVLLGLKKSILVEKQYFDPLCNIHICIDKLREKQYFPKFCSIFEVFLSKKSTEYWKKSNTWHICVHVQTNVKICLIHKSHCIFFYFFFTF